MWAFVFDWFDVCIIQSLRLEWPFCATWLSLAHTAAFVLQIHPRCVAFRRRKGSSRTSVKFKPANKRRGCSMVRKLLWKSERRVGEKWCMLLHLWSLATDGDADWEGGGGGRSLWAGRETPSPEAEVRVGWTKGPQVLTGWLPARARRGSASQNVGDGWRRASKRPWQNICICVIYHILSSFSKI